MKYCKFIAFLITISLHLSAQEDITEHFRQYVPHSLETKNIFDRGNHLATVSCRYVSWNTDSIVSAVNIFDSVTARDSFYYLAYEQKANLLLTASTVTTWRTIGLYQRVIDNINEMIRLNPGSAELHRFKGLVCSKLVAVQVAEQEFEQSLAMYEMELSAAKRVLDTMIVDTSGKIYSRRSIAYHEAKKAIARAICNKALALVLTNSPKGKVMLDSLCDAKNSFTDRSLISVYQDCFAYTGNPTEVDSYLAKEKVIDLLLTGHIYRPVITGAMTYEY